MKSSAITRKLPGARPWPRNWGSSGNIPNSGIYVSAAEERLRAPQHVLAWRRETVAIADEARDDPPAAGQHARAVALDIRPARRRSAAHRERPVEARPVVVVGRLVLGGAAGRRCGRRKRTEKHGEEAQA